MLENFKHIFRERWKFYMIGYLIGYLIPMLNDMKIDAYYLFPIKLMGIACALGVGTALYYIKLKMSVLEVFSRSLKYGGIIVMIFLVFLFIKLLIIAIFGFDITPYIGFSN